MVELAEYARTEINRIGGYYAYSKELVNGDSIYDFDVTKLSIHTLRYRDWRGSRFMIFSGTSTISRRNLVIWEIFWHICPSVTGQREVERLVSALAEIKRRFSRDKSTA